MDKKDMNGMTLAEEIRLLNEEWDSLSLEEQIASIGCSACSFFDEFGLCSYRENNVCPYGLGIIV